MTAHPYASTELIATGNLDLELQECTCGTPGTPEDEPCPYHSYDALDDPPQGCPVCNRLGRDEYGRDISHAACSRAVQEGVD